MSFNTFMTFIDLLQKYILTTLLLTRLNIQESYLYRAVDMHALSLT